MFLLPPAPTPDSSKGNTGRAFILMLAMIAGLWLASPQNLIGQAAPTATPSPQSNTQQQPNQADQKTQQNEQNKTPEAGGPTGSMGPNRIAERQGREPK